MSMPVMDGMSATRAIRQYEEAYNIPRCCIIALTGLASASAKLEAWNSGIDYFMTKPINFKELNEVLKTRPSRREDKNKNQEQRVHREKETANEIQTLKEEVAKQEQQGTNEAPTGESYKSPTNEQQSQERQGGGVEGHHRELKPGLG
jgi:DNA-binding response OmpR family regulator